ncbi:MAG: cyanophycinase [Planctomycetes bacterium]|nr:cyanophycinase [Planctomycetota bacterium]
MRPRPGIVLALFAACAFLCAACAGPAATSCVGESPGGVLWICGGGTLAPDVLAGFVSDAGGASARLVLIPGASRSADDADALERQLARWRARGIAEPMVLHTRSRAEADDEAFVAPLRQATAVWFGGGDQKRLAEVFAGTRVERELHALLARGGVIGGSSAGAAIQSKVMIAGGNPEPQIGTGLDLLPGAIIDQHFRARQREARLVAAVRAHPECTGYGIDEGTALVVRGGVARVLGAGGVTVVQARGDDEPGLRFVPAGETLELDAR